MAVKGESRLQRRIQRRLKREFANLFIMKVHGNEFQRAGIPDLLLCLQGLFISLEVKMPKGRLSDVQKEVIREIKKAGGQAFVVEDPETAVQVIRRVLGEKRYVPEKASPATRKSGRVHHAEKVFRSLLQTTPGKDVHRRRRH